MRIAVVILLVFAACGSLQRNDAESSATPPAAKVKHYRAWCEAEQKYLGDFDPDRSKAEELRTRHNKSFPNHIVKVQTVER